MFTIFDYPSAHLLKSKKSQYHYWSLINIGRLVNLIQYPCFNLYKLFPKNIAHDFIY